MKRSAPLALAAVLAVAPAAAAAPSGQEAPSKLLPAGEMQSIAAVENVSVTKGDVRGTVVNRSDAPIEDVAVLVQHLWLWGDEYEPGSVKEDPSLARFVEVGGPIAPGESREFTVEAPRAEEENGRFLVLVSIGKLEHGAGPSAGR